MSYRIDLNELARRESEQTEWKENVADTDDVVATLSAFANDLQNLGGGYVVCGAKEEKDAAGFPRLVRAGLTANQLKQIEGTVFTRCRERVSPPITPLVEELPADDASRRILVFIQPATGTAHTFRRGNDGAKHYVRVSRSTQEARNGILKDLLVRKGVLEPWDRRACAGATESDLDLLVLRDALQRMGVFSSERGIEPFLSTDTQISPFVPPLFAREPLTNVLRPRNFAILLFGRETQRFVPGAVSHFSIYPDVDRSDPHAERHDLAGNLLEQARRISALLDMQSSYIAFDKEDPTVPNILKYPKRALQEAMINALAHRDYERPDPTRLTVFANRIEVLSPGALPTGMNVEAFREGRADSKWRNQVLAWFFQRLQLAQAEGQGIPTILRVMRDEGCPAPIFDVDGARVVCILPAHPRHAVLRDLRLARQLLAHGELVRAQEQVRAVFRSEPLNSQALQLFAEIQQGLHDPEPIIELVETHIDRIEGLPPTVLVQLAEALASHDASVERSLAQRLLDEAARGPLEERELRRIATTMIRVHDEQTAIALIERQLTEHPEWERYASVRQLRGDALIGLANRCRMTAMRHGIASATRVKAWNECDAYAARAERELREALSLSVDAALTQQIHRKIEYLQTLKRENQLFRMGDGRNMDKDARNAIERATQRARKRLEEDFAAQLEGTFDILREGKVAAKAGLHLSARQVLQRDKIVAALEHKRAAGMSAVEAVADYVRDAAFTTLNRFVALKMLEARELVQQCISKGEQSSGYREFCGMAAGVTLLPDGAGYRLYIESLFDELSTEVKVLFDRRDPASVLWPKRATFEALLEILNGAELAGVWGEDETIGWVYQYFNGGDERRAMREASQAPRNSRELAVRNQFFTPRYVVQFLTDNTLGRIWYEMRDGQTALADRCEYMVRRPDETWAPRRKKDPRDIRVLDPACGSGHFLLYAFDLLHAIYEEAHGDPDSPTSEATGKTLAADYPSIDALRRALPALILAHNLHGVDIDARCAQIAQLALWMRAQRAFRDFGIGRTERQRVRRSNIVVAEPLVADEATTKDFVARLGDAEFGRVFKGLIETLKLAGELGLLLRVEKLVSRGPQRGQTGELFAPPEERIRATLDAYVASESVRASMRRRLFVDDAVQGMGLLAIAEKKFDVVLMNPPFGAGSTRAKKDFEKAYPRTKNDVYAAFVERGIELLSTRARLGAITSRTGFFLSSFQKWREDILLKAAPPVVFADLGAGVLDSAMVETAAYCLEAQP